MVITKQPVERFDLKRKKPKRIAVSSKHQITIPKEFYEQLNIGEEVTIELLDNQLIIKPINESFEDFSEEILRDLIAENYEQDELIAEFARRKSQMKNAVNALIKETISKKIENH